MSYLLPYFGEINPAQLKGYYRATAVVKGLTVKLDLNFKGKTIRQEALRSIEEFLNYLARWDGHHRAALEEDVAADGETAKYLAFYFEELDEAERSSLLPVELLPGSHALWLLKELQLIRVGLYPDGQYDVDQFACFDYSIYLAGKPCDQLLVVSTDEQGKIDHISWES